MLRNSQPVALSDTASRRIASLSSTPAMLPGSAARERVALDELCLVYQPIHDVATGTMIALEALARWRRDDIDVMSADAFIALAERNGQIVELGRRILRLVCRQMALWSGTRYGGLPVSINISPRQFQDPGFVNDVSDCLQSYGVEPERLVIEVTEREPFAESLYAASAIAALRELGVKLVLDDFGSGYMNIATLLQHGIDGIKLSLGIPWGGSPHADPRAWEVIRALGHMCERIGITLVVERVETAAQWALLQQLPGVRAQGYLLGKPMSADSFPMFSEQVVS
ncbi:EAL domain-containing protein [Pseudomonadota bacterium AL_CKDN230030165-1A_HGKHYDSX7]